MKMYKRWLHQRMDELDELYSLPDPNEEVWRRSASIVEEAGDRAARLGLADLFQRAQKVGCFTGPENAKSFLSDCLAAIPVATDKVLTVTQVSEILKVKADTVRGWIAAGRLKASNTGNGSQRPRYRIAQADLDTFLGSRTRKTAKPVKRRKRPSGDVFQYFPER